MSDSARALSAGKVMTRQGLVALSALVALAIFVFDLMTPQGVAAPVLYVGLILLSRRSKYPPYALIFAGIATALTIIGFFLSPADLPRVDLADRGLAIFAIWLTAVLCYRHIRMVHRLDRSNRDLKRQVADTVTETVQAVAELRSEREDRRHTEAELQDAEARFIAIFNQTYQLIAVLDPDGSVEDANDTLMMACGQTRREMEGKPIWSLKALAANPFGRDRLRAAVEDAANGNFTRTEVKFTDVNGKVLTMDVSIKPIRDSELIIRLLIFEARDITEQQENLQRLHRAQKAEVVGRLASGIAHDFNNILAVIGGHLEMSEGRLRNDDRHAVHVRRALEAVFRGGELTRQLLSFSRKRRLQRRSVDTGALIRESLRLADHALLEDVEIVTDLANPTWPVLSDPSALQTALLSLIVDGKDSMPNGGKITVKTVNTQLAKDRHFDGVALDPGAYVLLSIIDEGAGIPSHLLDRVTEPYFRTRARGVGTGLGLSMVSQFARQTGGAMHITSTVGVGTTVTLYLPRSDPSALSEVDAIGQSTATMEESHGERILVVEDDPDVRENVVTMLMELGYAVTEAGTVAMALSILDEQPVFDLVFSDIALPGGSSGRDLAEEIARSGTGVKVLLTTGVPDGAGDKTLRSGDVPVLAKPYRYAELASAIRSVLSQ